uniref:Uncharacterized protein n=1 Tax=Anopheles minimus TaxID=112268 RepID=A0A182WNT7_9DIPT
MRKSVIVVTVVLLAQCFWCFPVAATPGRPPYGAPVYVSGGVRPVIARPGIYRAPVIYRPPVVVQKVIQPVIVQRPVVPILAG